MYRHKQWDSADQLVSTLTEFTSEDPTDGDLNRSRFLQ